MPRMRPSRRPAPARSFDPDTADTLCRRAILPRAPPMSITTIDDGDRALQEGARDRAGQSGDPPAPDDLAARSTAISRRASTTPTSSRTIRPSSALATIVRGHGCHPPRHDYKAAARLAEIRGAERSRPADRRSPARLGASRRRPRQGSAGHGREAERTRLVRHLQGLQCRR